MDEVFAQLLKAGVSGVVIVGVILILKQVDKMRKPIEQPKPDDSPAYWRSEFRHAVLEAVSPMMAAQTELLRQMKHNDDKSLEKLTEMSAGIKELVEISRFSRTMSQGGD